MQEQHDIMVRFLDGTHADCARTGNNAAWACPCGRKRPLVGYSDEVSSPKDFSRVVCPDCKRAYRVVAPGIKQAPTHVEEVHA